MNEVVLLIGSEGQVGSELAPELCKRFGESRVIRADIRPANDSRGFFRRMDVTDPVALRETVKEFRVTVIYHLVSILSAAGEKDPESAWRVNLEGLRNVMEISRQEHIRRVFWPSSIAAFGPHTEQTRTHQFTVMDPNTMYGITKVTGELLCSYAFTKYGLDTRCLRYPGLISWKTPPGGGTTDFAIDMFYAALRQGRYTCYLRSDTTLPMMYMPDAVRATIDFMQVPREQLRTHLGYNLGAMSFAPRDLEREIRRFIPTFVCTYEPDERQHIADSWPRSIDDAWARRDWGWRQRFTLRRMVADMLHNLRHLDTAGWSTDAPVVSAAYQGSHSRASQCGAAT